MISDRDKFNDNILIINSYFSHCNKICGKGSIHTVYSIESTDNFQDLFFFLHPHFISVKINSPWMVKKNLRIIKKNLNTYFIYKFFNAFFLTEGLSYYVNPEYYSFFKYNKND